MGGHDGAGGEGGRSAAWSLLADEECVNMIMTRGSWRSSEWVLAVSGQLARNVTVREMVKKPHAQEHETV